MIYLVVTILIYLVCFAAIVVFLGPKLAPEVDTGQNLIANLQHEYDTKKKILSDLAAASLGLINKTEHERVRSESAALEESIRAEKGRLTITEAELEAVDTRLRELEEIKRELEVSNMDAIKELEMLRAQERDAKAQNDALRSELESSFEQLEMLLEVLASSAAAVSRLNSAKNELVATEKKCTFYEEQIALINGKYMALKKAYDALDIEYAQLYEKQQSAEFK